jgi:starch synthase
LIEEIITIIEEYKVDGIYLDNGFEWPQIYKINEDEMYRK